MFYYISFCTSTLSRATDSARRESSAGVRLGAIDNATCVTLFMEAGKKIALSRTVKHGALSLSLLFLGKKELGPRGVENPT